jgi:hypothetical protein
MTRARAAQVAEQLHIDPEGVSLDLYHDNHKLTDKIIAETRPPLGEITGNSISVADQSDDNDNKSIKKPKSRGIRSPNASTSAGQTKIDQVDEQSGEAYKIMSGSLHAPKPSMRKRSVDDLTKQYNECKYALHTWTAAPQSHMTLMQGMHHQCKSPMALICRLQLI